MGDLASGHGGPAFSLGAHIPSSWSLDFAIPLTFLALLFPTIRNHPSAIAAVCAGILALAGHKLPYNLGLFFGLVLVESPRVTSRSGENTHAA